MAASNPLRKLGAKRGHATSPVRPMSQSCRPGIEALEDRSVPAAMPGAGSGLVGNYFSDTTLANLAATRLDSIVDFNWSGSPAAGAPADNFSVRWTGQVQAQYSETYTFSVASDEGVRLSVNGKSVIDAWTATTPGTRSGTVALKAGEVYDLKLEAKDAAGAAAVKLQWSSPSTPLAVVPAAQLYARGGWLDADVGSPGIAGSVRSTGAAYTLTGSGAGTATADEGNFAYQWLDGSGDVIARVTGVSGSAEAGLMLRDGTAAGSVSATVTVTSSGSRFDFRSVANGGEVNAGTTSAAGPVWLKLHRDGKLVSGYTSASGADGTWSLVGTATVPLGGSVYAGLYVTSGSDVVIQAATFTNVGVTSAAPVGANLDAIVDWNLSKVFVDAFKQSRAPISQSPGRGGYPATVDADGWATEDALYYIQTGALGQAHNFNGTYKLSFTGRADIGLSITQGSVSNVVYNAATNKTTADVTVNHSDADDGWYIALQFFNTNGGVKNIKMIRPGYAADTTQVFTNEFLASVAPFDTIRFMDWLHTNGSPNVNWSERAKPTDATQATNKGVAWDYVVRLANDANKDIWINIPLHATDDYVRNLATYLKANLEPDRVVYLEYSNEVWNTIFPQGIENIHLAVAEVEAGMASGNPSPLFYTGEGAKRDDGSWVHDYDWAMRRVARELKDITNIFASVYGSDQINNRIRPVLANQQVNPYIVNTQLDFLERTYGNPTAYVTAVAGTTFFNATTKDDVPRTAEELLEFYIESIGWENTFYAPYTVIALSHGLQNFVTEGGIDTFGSNNVQAKKEAALDPGMADRVRQFLTNWFRAGGGQFNWFVAGATSYDTNFGTWGLTNDISNLDTPKYQAVEDILTNAPPAPTIGTAIPNTVAGTGYFGSQATADPYLRYAANGAKLDYLVRAPIAGDYKLTLDYAATAAGQVEVWVNGTKVGTLNLSATGSGTDGQGAANTFGNSQTFTLKLGAGLSDVQLRVVTGGFSLRTLTFAAPSGTTQPQPGNQAPTITTQPTATEVRGTASYTLSTAAADDGGEANLTYTWSVVAAPASAGVPTFSANGTNAAKNATVTFTAAGPYALRLTVRDAQGLVTTQDVSLTAVVQLAAVYVEPGTVTVVNGQTQQFTARVLDQFGNPFNAGPVVWSIEGQSCAPAGTITQAGLYTAPVSGTGAVVVKATVTGGYGAAQVSVTAQQIGGSVDYSAGFTSTSALAVNGTAVLSGSRLRLTSASNQAAGVFSKTPVGVGGFTSRFQFQLASLDGSPWSIGDGIAFVIQGAGTTALGAKGGGLGYTGIGKSVAVKFDLSNNSGEGANSTGLYLNGVNPTTPATSLDGTGIDLHSGHVFTAELAYDGTTLTVTITDTHTGVKATQKYTVNIQSAVGGSTAYVGFTAGTAVLAANQDILNWTFTSGAATPSNPPRFLRSYSEPVQTTGEIFLDGISDGGTGAKTYTYTVVGKPAGAENPRPFGDRTYAVWQQSYEFFQAGQYLIDMTVTDSTGASATQRVTVIVTQVLAGVRVSPDAVSVTPGGTRQFTVAGLDQFGDPLASPVVAVWRILSGPGTIDANGLYRAPATGSGTAVIEADVETLKDTAAVTVTAAPTGGTGVDYSGGFTSAGGLALNNGSAVTGGILRLVDGQKSKATSAFAVSKLGVAAFTTTFDFRLASIDGNPWSLGDGITFMITQLGPDGVGLGGSGLGSQGLGGGLAIKFDLTNNAGEGANSTGLYLNGAAPTTPSTSLDGTGIDLHSGHTFAVSMTYDGTTLTVTITDKATGAKATQRYTVNIPQVVGGSTAYVGFTAGTGALTGRFDVLNWKFTPTTTASATSSQTALTDRPPTFLETLGGGTYTTDGVIRLSAAATDDQPAGVTYSWQVVSAPAGAPAPKAFGDKLDPVWVSRFQFFQAGDYVIRATATDSAGQTATTTGTVRVTALPTTAEIGLADVVVTVGQSKQLAVAVKDQFGKPVTTPGAVTWAVAGGGTVSAAGVYTAPATGTGIATVKATVGGLVAAVPVTYLDPSAGPAPVVVSAAGVVRPWASGSGADLGVLVADDGGPSNLTYSWSVVSAPAGGAVLFDPFNGTTAARTIGAEVFADGAYRFRVRATDSTGRTADSFADVVFNGGVSV